MPRLSDSLTAILACAVSFAGGSVPLASAMELTPRTHPLILSLDGVVGGVIFASRFDPHDDETATDGVDVLADLEAGIGVRLGDFSFTANAAYLHWDDHRRLKNTAPDIHTWLELSHTSGIAVQYGDINGRRMPVSRGILNNPYLQTWNTSVSLMENETANPFSSTTRDVWQTNLQGGWYTQTHSSDKKIGLTYEWENGYVGAIYDIGEISNSTNNVSGESGYYRLEGGLTFDLAVGELKLAGEYIRAPTYTYTNGVAFNALGDPISGDGYTGAGFSILYSTEQFDIGAMIRRGHGPDISSNTSVAEDDRRTLWGVFGSIRLDDKWEVAAAYKRFDAQYSLIGNGAELEMSEIQFGIAYRINEFASIGWGIRKEQADYRRFEAERISTGIALQISFWQTTGTGLPVIPDFAPARDQSPASRIQGMAWKPCPA